MLMPETEQQQSRRLTICPYLKQHLFISTALNPFERCSIVSSNSFLSQRNPSLTEVMRAQVFLCVCDSVCSKERGLCVRGLPDMGMSCSSNIDTRVCCYFRLFEPSIYACGMFVSDPHTLLGEVPLSPM